MKYQKGDEVRIKGIDWYNKNKDKSGSVFANGIPFCEEMSEYCGAYVTIAEVYNDHYTIRGVPYCWTDGMIECLTDAHCKLSIVPTEKGSELIPREGFEIKQEGEKFYLVKKKKEYPKTYEECREIIKLGKEHTLEGEIIRINNYKIALLESFQKLLICRDAYWKLYGEEKGLGKPWEPDYDSGVNKYGIICMNGVVQESNPATNWERHLNKVLDFPTREMRDAFYENFKGLIESCKELL